MPKSLVPLVARVVPGAVVVAALAALPLSARAADTNVTGTLTGGLLTNTAPAITPFSAALTGVNRAITTGVGGWTITDATGSNAGYSVTVSATAPTVDGSTTKAGTGSSLSLTPSTATAAAGNPATVGPTASAPQLLGPSAVTIESAAQGAGQGAWNLPAVPAGLSVVIPGDARVGAYSSTLTFTAAQPAL